MVTVLSWSNSNGLQGRCDAKCHNAKSPPSACKCICGGRYHGTARQGTFHAVREQHGLEILDQAKANAQARGYKLKHHKPVRTLF